MSDENELRDEYERGFTDGYCCDAEQWDPAKAKALESCGWVRVVRCRDCKHFMPLLNFCTLLFVSGPNPLDVRPDDYCSRGERREP